MYWLDSNLERATLSILFLFFIQISAKITFTVLPTNTDSQSEGARQLCMGSNPAVVEMETYNKNWFTDQI